MSSRLETSMKHLFLAVQIIDYQACKIIASHSNQRAIQEKEHNKELKKEISEKQSKVVHNVPADTAISLSLQQMGDKEKQTVEKLHEIPFYLALKGHPFTNF